MSKRQPSAARNAAEPYRLADLMARVGYADEDSFRGWRRRAEAMGFPPPLPGCTRPLKWSRVLVDRWFEEGGRPAQTAIAALAATPAPIDEIAAARERMKRKAAAA